MNDLEWFLYYPDEMELSEAGLAIYRNSRYRIYVKVTDTRRLFKLRDGSRWVDGTFATLHDIDEWLTEQEEREEL